MVAEVGRILVYVNDDIYRVYFDLYALTYSSEYTGKTTKVM